VVNLQTVSVGVKISFITLNVLSQSTVEITYVSTALNSSCWIVVLLALAGVSDFAETENTISRIDAHSVTQQLNVWFSV